MSHSLTRLLRVSDQLKINSTGGKKKGVIIRTGTEHRPLGRISLLNSPMRLVELKWVKQLVEFADSITSTVSNPVSSSGTGTNVFREFSRMRQSLRSGLLN